MVRNTVFIAAAGLVFLTMACVKETYDLKKLSDEVRISPVFALPVAKGDITFADMVKPSDTVRFDNDKFVKIVVKKDTIFNFRIKDYYDFSDMVSFEKGYIFGEVMINDFQSSLPVTLNTITQYFSPALRAQFQALDDGQPHNFPPFPYTDIGKHAFSVLNGFDYAIFAKGTVEISVRNNLTAPLSNIRVRLYNSPGYTPVGPEVIVPSIDPGATRSVSIDLAGISVSNALLAGIIFTGSPGASNVIIDLDHTVEFVINGYNLKIISGRIIVPVQTLGSLDNIDTLDFDPGEGIEIEKGRIKNGYLNYTAVSKSNLNTSVFISLPTAKHSGIPVSESIILTPNQTKKGTLDFGNTEIDLSTDSQQPYNRLPVNYEIKVSSNGQMINYSKYDNIYLILKMPDPEIDYMKGYFGQKQEDIKPDTIDTGLEEILEKITGDFYISNPSIKVNYSNSFGIPVGITLQATGKRDSRTVNLNLAPFTIDYPVYPLRDKTSSFTVNKSNSNLPDLISLPPLEIRFSGSGKMNPAGPEPARNNYVFDNSRFVASLEIEVPLEFRINNLQFADTTDNFLKSDRENDDSPFKPENMEYFRLKITATNGFPLGASMKLKLYDPVAKKVLHTVNAPDIIKPAQVNAAGKVTTPAETVTTIELDKTFFEVSSNTDKMIFLFTFVTSDGGTKDVKIYSDYAISFKATIVAKPNIIFN